MRSGRVLIALSAAIAVSLMTLNGQSNREQARQPQTLAVSGASNSTPSLAAEGRTVAAVWTATKSGSTNVYFALSNDGGTIFSPPKQVNDQDGDAGATNEQPPRVTISGTSAARTFTVVWSKRDPGPQDTRRDIIRMARSTDAGHTFSPARFTHDPSFSGARGWESLAVGGDEVVHAVWLDGREAGKKVAAMAHGGTPHKGQPPQEIYHGTLGADGRMVETRIAEDVCFCCKTAIAVDSRGGVYAAWRHVFRGSMRDIAFAKSTDGGRHFSPLVRVSEDNWELNGCPEDGPSLAVDSSGTIHIAWATVVNDGEPHKALFYTTSRDGKVFSRRTQVPTNAMSTPGHPQLALMSNGGVAIVFDESMGSARRVSLARVLRNGELQAPEVLSADDSATQPVITTTPGELLIAWTSRSGNSPNPSTIRIVRVR